MFEIKPMRVQDFEFATQLANTMNWNMAPEDFQFAVSLEPEGCFVAFDGFERVGIVTCVSFGKVGWFGNLVVNDKSRKQGVGSLLVKHTVNYLQGKGAQSIGLYAYPNLLGFYSKLGFKADEEFYVLQSEAVNSMSAQKLPKVGKHQLTKMVAFDAEYFGGDRKKLLESIILEKGNLSYCKVKHDEVVGYVTATIYERMAWLGPLICKAGDGEDAVSLIKMVLSKLTGKNVYAVISKKEAALANVFYTSGFIVDFPVSRMFLGEFAAKNCIYLPESLERG
jgi:predicted N-acetyltransferase YhbS